MKIARKFLVVLLAVVLVTSACVLSASAAASADYTKWLEYYDSGIFASSDFSDEDALELLHYSPLTPEFKTEGEDTYVSFTEPADLMSGDVTPIAFLTKVNGSAGIVLRFKSAADTAEKAGYLLVEFSGDSAMESNTDNEVDFVMDFRNTGKLLYGEYSLLDEDKTALNGFDAEGGVWYTLSLFYNSKLKTVTGSVAADGQEETAFELNTSKMISSLDEIDVRFRNKDNEGTVIALDYINVYSGSVPRNNMRKQEILDNAAVSMVADFHNEATSFEKKQEIVDVLTALITRGYAPVADAAVKAVYGGEGVDAEYPYSYFCDRFYIDYFKELVSAIDNEKTYDVRKAALDVITPVYEIVKLKTETGLSDAIDTYNAEVTDLNKVKEASENFITKVTSTQYQDLSYKDLLDWVEDLENTDYDITFRGVSYAVEMFNSAKSYSEKLTVTKDAFIAACADIDNPEKNFGEKYAAFVVANENMFEDESAEGITEALAIYNDNKTEMETGAAYCDNFLMQVSKAKNATVHESRKSYVQGALQIIGEGKLDGSEAVYTGYPDIVEAIDDVMNLVEKISTDEIAAAAYLAKVAEIDNCATFAAKKACVLECLELQKTGDVSGILGIREANVKVASVYADVCVTEEYSKRLVSDVTKLMTLDSLSDRFDLIVSSIENAKYAEPAYEGVAQALNNLKIAKECYDEDVESLNNSLDNASENALNISVNILPKAEIKTFVYVERKFLEKKKIGE